MTEGGLTRLPASRAVKWLVLVFWLIVAVFAGPLSGKLTDVEKNEASSFLPGDAESTEVFNLRQRFTDGELTVADVVYERGSGITAADQDKVRSDAERIADVEGVEGPIQPAEPSEDGKALRLTVPIRPIQGPEFADQISAIRDITHASGGLTSHVTGPAGQQADQLEVFEDIDTRLLFSTLIVVVVILLLTYRSPFLWLIPVVCAGISLITAQACNYLLAKYAGLTVNGQSAGILLVLVFGAGTDYALLLVARYREELRRHEDRHEAMAFALRRAGPALLASAATVILGLLCLLVARLNSTSGLGPVGAVGITCALAVMITLLPALLVIGGRWMFWPFIPRFGSPSHEVSGPWGRIARRVGRRPRAVWVSTVAVLGVMCFGLLDLDTSGLTAAESFRTTPDSVAGQRVVERHFAAGTTEPVVVIGNRSAQAELARAIQGTDGVAPQTQPAVFNDDLVEIDAVLEAPPDSQAAKDTIDRLRDAVHAVPNANAKVGGNTAINLDVQRAASFDTAIVIPIVLAVVLVILAVLLRAILAPVLLIATVLLSFGAALGASAFLFDVGFGFAGADPSVPLFVFIFLVALGIDYNIFLMTRIREEAGQLGTRDAALKGVAVTGGVITSAGVVLAGTFSVLAVLPLVVFAEVGFAVAFGVLLDTLIVRSVLVPALTVEVGERIWWPSALARAGHGAPTAPD